MKRLIAGLLAAACLCVPQAGDAPDDPQPEYPGQKLWCSNTRSNAHPCHCALATSCDAHRQPNPDLYGDGDQEMGSKCKTFCKKDHCHCLSPCTS